MMEDSASGCRCANTVKSEDHQPPIRRVKAASHIDDSGFASTLSEWRKCGSGLQTNGQFAFGVPLHTSACRRSKRFSSSSSASAGSSSKRMRLANASAPAPSASLTTTGGASATTSVESVHMEYNHNGIVITPEDSCHKHKHGARGARTERVDALLAMSVLM